MSFWQNLKRTIYGSTAGTNVKPSTSDECAAPEPASPADPLQAESPKLESKPAASALQTGTSLARADSPSAPPREAAAEPPTASRSAEPATAVAPPPEADATKPSLACDTSFLIFTGNLDRKDWLNDSLHPLRPNWNFEVVDSREAAFARLSQYSYDAVIVDLPSPVRAGLDVLDEAFKRSPNSLRCIRCSTSERGQIKNFQGPMPEFLSSDFDPSSLAAALDRALQLRLWVSDPQLKKLVSSIRRVPSLPSIYTQVMAELNKPDGSVHVVGQLISREIALTAKILQLVNSAVFGLPRQIDDPVEAVFFLGMERTKSLILLAHAFLHFDQSRCPGFSHDNLWRHSLATATSAASITLDYSKDSKEADLAFTAGLLHDLGMLLFAANLSEPYSAMIQQSQTRKDPIHVLEREIFGASHAELGACLLGTWNLPLNILQAIYWHTNPRESGSKEFTLVTAVYLANIFEAEKNAGSGAPPRVIDTAYLESIGVMDRMDSWRRLCGVAAKQDQAPSNASQGSQEAEAV